jgi:acyl-CoA thioesterase
VGRFDAETAVVSVGSAAWRTELSSAWDIGGTANGGYALTPVLRALVEAGGHPDPLSVTTHFLRPVRGAGGADVVATVVRQGRTTTVARGELQRDGRELLLVHAVLGDLSEPAGAGHDLSVAAPPIPPPDACVHRSELAQGVELPILDRLDVRIHPERAVPGGSAEAVIEGWIRFEDGSDPSTLALPLLVDAFPPTLYSRFGSVGWVPTIELTVHVRRRPAPGWIQARLECDDLADGRMVETGTLWDESGAVVARSRQLGLLLAE